MRPRLSVALLLPALLGLWAGARSRAAEDTGAAVAGPVMVDEGAVPPALLEVARRVADRPLGERMAAVSDVLLGRPYLVDAAGEGLPPDRDPPARYDAFDCLTFVEEVLALALPADPLSAPMVRNGLRYGQAEPRYENRRHFMLTEWVPGAVADGWLVDITESLGDSHRVGMHIEPRTWAGWRRRKLFQLPDERLPTGYFDLPVLSLDAAMEAAPRIPDGALVLTVRQARAGVPMVVTHLGFKLPSDPERPMMRHATKMKGQQVKDHSLLWYLDHLRWYDRWPVEGVTILMPQEFGPRAHRLEPEPAAGG